jgi:hypothetical protein
MSRKTGKGEGRSGSRARARSKTPQSTPRLRLYTPALPPETASEGDVSPLELYRSEKARRARAMSGDVRLEQAKAEYQALLAADAAKGKGGRPRKKAATPDAPAAAARATLDGDEDAELEEGDETETESDAEGTEDEEPDKAS